MNDVVIGRALRVLRLRLHLRQVDVGARAGVSQQLVSRIERGRSAGVTAGTLRRVFAAVDADVTTIVRWRAGELDRLMDDGHAQLVARVAGLLHARGWMVLTEVTFSTYGERGAIDLLAWHAATRSLLIVEVKTEIASAEEMLRRHDLKVRLAPEIGLERFGDRPARVGRLLVVDDTSANRRRAGSMAPLLGLAYPSRGRAVREWLRAPAGELRGMAFSSAGRGLRRAGGSRRRVRLRAAA